MLAESREARGEAWEARPGRALRRGLTEDTTGGKILAARPSAALGRLLVDAQELRTAAGTERAMAGVLVVMIVLSGLGMLVSYRHARLEAVRERVKSNLSAIDQALTQFAILNGGRYPHRLDDLLSFRRGFIVDPHLPRDPWGRLYVYEPPGADSHPPRVICYGRNGVLGGSGADEDFDSLSLRETGTPHR